jgi:predicted regulator of Ras-like GTPase activity (Roadblock/LC7/MglB family)
MRNLITTPETKFREITNQLRNNVSGTKAILLIGPDGVMLEHLAIDPRFDVEAFAAEYAMLLRIAKRTSEDTGAGGLNEFISVCDRSVIVAYSFASEFYLVLVSNDRSQIGRARYELKRAASSLRGYAR